MTNTNKTKGEGKMRDSRKINAILDEVLPYSSGCTNKQLEDYINKIYDERFAEAN